ncbi:MAG: PAS domain-containing protein [Treponemataceae bacterium]|nr:PAS domain-containing protein [Treponemataceae bacterium]
MDSSKDTLVPFLPHNGPLFRNMASFLDAIWEIDIYKKTVRILLDKLRTELNGKDLSFSELAENAIKYEHPEDVDKILQLVDFSYLNTLKDDFSFETRVITPDGRYHTVRREVTPYFDEEGDVTHVYVSCKDIQSLIDEREEARLIERQSKELSRMNGMLHQMTERFPLGILSYTVPDHKILLLNEEACRIFAFPNSPPSQVQGNSLMQYIMEEDLPNVREALKGLNKVGDEISYTFRTKRENGATIFVACTTKLCQFFDGTRYILSALRDVTHIENLTRNLRRERTEFRDALTHNARYWTSFDVTDGYFRNDIIRKDGKSLFDILGLELPVHYDELHSFLREKFHAEYLDDLSERTYTCRGLLELFEEGHTEINVNTHLPERDIFQNQLLLLSKDEETEHILCYIISYDVSEQHFKERQHQMELQNALKLAEELNFRTKLIAGQSQEFLTLVNDLSESGMWYFYFSEDGQIDSVFWSEKCRQMIGVKNKKEFPDRLEPFFNRLHPDDREMVVEKMRETIAGNNDFDAEFRLRTNSEGYVWFKARGKCARHANGKPRLVFGTNENINNAKHQAEDMNSRMAAMIGGVNGGLAINECKGHLRYEFVDERVAAIQGYTAQEFMDIAGKSFMANVWREDKKRIRNETSGVFRAGGAFSLKYRVSHKNGSIKWVNDFGHVVTMPDGKLKVYRLIQDVTGQEELNQKLSSEQKQYREALTKSALYSFSFDVTEGVIKDPIYTADGEDVLARIGLSAPCRYDDECRRFIEQMGVVFINPRAKKIFSQKGILSLYKEGITSDYMEYYIKARDSYVRTLFLLSKDAKSGHVMATIIDFDATASIKAEKEQQRLLQEALIQAENANKAKTAFLSNMSHDIRTPMNAIVGYSVLAENHPAEPEQVSEYLEKIQTSSKHLLNLINDVLDMSRIESGKVTIDENRISLPEMMQEIKTIVLADVRNKSLNLRMETTDLQNETIWSDKLRLNQILLNCLSNAIKFTPKSGSVGLMVSQLPCAKKGFGRFQFKVTDTGIGMSPEFLEHIFEPFEREANSTVSGIPGTGLGMSICKNIVDLMGGTIHVDSEKGIGTEITIDVLFRVEENGLLNHDNPLFADKSVLYLDRNADTCVAVNRMLHEFGLKSDFAADFDQSVQKNRFYDVYIVGSDFEDSDAMNLVKKIRSRKETEKAYIILASYDWTEMASGSSELENGGINAFCPKPLSRSSLYQVLSLLFENNGKMPAQKKKSVFAKEAAGVKVLLAEDNEVNRDILSKILSENGADVQCVFDGKAAVEKISAMKPDEFDVVFMDIQMPVMNGYEASKLIRGLSRPYQRSIPIIAMTANAFEEDKKQALECGMNAHVAKPIDIDAFFSTLHQVLGR